MTIEALVEHLDQIVEHQDTCIDIVAGGAYEGQQTSREEAVIGCQTWRLAFSDDGKAFAAKHHWTGSPLQLVDWLAKNYPLRFSRDPVPSWRKQIAALRRQRNPHAALAHHHSFMAETSKLREAIEESAGQAEAEIDALIDRQRGK